MMILLDNGDLNLVAVADINAGQEITIDYRQALSLAIRRN
jgi:SET domain-containing protein